MEVRSEPLSMSDLFEGLSGILKPLLQTKELSIETQVANDVPIIQTDPAKLQQVLYNFLSNAIKFSPKGSQIDLRAERLEMAQKWEEHIAPVNERLQLSLIQGRDVDMIEAANDLKFG